MRIGKCMQKTFLLLSAHSRHLVVSSLTVTLMGLAMGRAAVTHDFSGGSGTSDSTQFVGTAGNGWTNAFTASTENASVSNSIISTSPMIAGGGDYLQRTVTGGASAGNRRSVLYRTYGSSGDLDTTQAHTISFLWRADSVGSGFNSTADYFMLFGNSGAPNLDSSANTSWLIRYQGASQGGAGDIVGGKFAVYDGTRTGGTMLDATLFADTGMAVSVGTVYQFTIQTDPVTANWSVNIQEVGGSNSYQSSTLGWRNAANNTSTTIGWGAKPSATDEAFTFSLDNISVVPEPGTAILGAFGALLLIRRKRD